MVQVDVFWSFGIGAGVALANWRQLRLARAPRAEAAPVALGDPLRDVLLFLSVAFAPSGLYLLTSFPHWETMHVARTLSDLPPWLVTLFAVTNVTQGLLGYKLAERLIVRDRPYPAFLLWMGGYFAMFLTLVHGWDGTGYQRFFSARPEQLGSWQWSDAASWVVSDVGLTLAAMGVVIIPWLLAMMARPLTAGYRLPDGAPAARGRSTLGVALAILLLNTVVLVAVAVAASLLLRAFGPWLGAPLFAAIAWFALIRPGSGALHRIYRALAWGDPLIGAPQRALAGAGI